MKAPANRSFQLRGEGVKPVGTLRYGLFSRSVFLTFPFHRDRDRIWIFVTGQFHSYKISIRNSLATADKSVKMSMLKIQLTAVVLPGAA
jgi:hypothetical protein